MGKFKQWLYRTFSGSYGIDKLYFVLFGVAMLFIIINLFVNSFVFIILEILTVGYMLFRAFSHNRLARRKENDFVFGIFRRIKGFFKLQKNKFKDRKTHVYRKCPACHAVLRLPKRGGTHVACCPRCQRKFDVKG
ncbi:MAG: hypothetical protein IJX46_09790 [Clostridia bacterium]|nr:hypothetical protein [Clostridia bacterium]